VGVGWGWCRVVWEWVWGEGPPNDAHHALQVTASPAIPAACSPSISPMLAHPSPLPACLAHPMLIPCRAWRLLATRVSDWVGGPSSSQALRLATPCALFM